MLVIPSTATAIFSPNGLVDSLYGHETNRLYRQSWD